MKTLAIIAATAFAMASPTVAMASIGPYDVVKPSPAGYTHFPHSCETGNASAFFHYVFHKYEENSIGNRGHYWGIQRTPNMDAGYRNRVSCLVMSKRKEYGTEMPYFTRITVEDKGHGRILFWKSRPASAYVPGME